MTHAHSLSLPWSTSAGPRQNSPADPGAEALEIVALWGDSVLSVRHLCPPRSFVIGDGSAPSDFVLPEELGTGPQHILCAAGRGAVTITDESGRRLPLALEQPRTVTIGPLTFRCTLTSKEPPRFAVRTWDLESVGYFAASVASTLALVVAAAWFAPPLGVTDEEELDRNRLQTMLQILQTQAEREQLAGKDAGTAESPRATQSEGARSAPGALGRPNAPALERHFASRAPAAERDLSRAQQIAEAQSFGLIPLLRAEIHPGALWERDGALNPLERDALGGLFARELGESAGTGGLSPSGPGQGSGGPGTGISLGQLGTCQTLGGCRGGQAGFARDAALGASGHAIGVPRVRPNGNPDVSGVLPAELVQRVVRQNFGRFRNCYEQGLRKNPSLSGRVTARFVIDREGAVTQAQNGDSDLPDSWVVSCVVSAFYGLSFPAPDNGVVRVSYPIVFSVG